MKGIKLTQLQYDYRGINDDSRYQIFTTFHNKIYENYSMLLEQKTTNPVIILKSKIKHMSRGNDVNNGLWGGLGGLSGGKCRGRRRQGG